MLAPRPGTADGRGAAPVTDESRATAERANPVTRLLNLSGCSSMSMWPPRSRSSHRAPGISDAMRRDSQGGVMTSAAPPTTSVGTSMFGRSSVRSTPRITPGTPRRVSLGHSSIICLTISKSEAFASRPKPTRVSNRPRSRAPQIADVSGAAPAIRRTTPLSQADPESASGVLAIVDSSTRPATRSASTRRCCTANACAAIPPIECPTITASRRSRPSSTDRKSYARLSIVIPASPATEPPCPRWSKATTRNPSAGSASNCRTQVRAESVTP